MLTSPGRAPASALRLLRRRLIEPLATPHGLDRYAAALRPGWSPRDARAEISEARANGTGTVTLTLRPSERWRGFRAGQFVRLTVEIDGVRETRCYSPTCSEHRDGELELTIRTHPAGRVSSYLNEHARGGMLVGCSGPEGEFTLPRRRPERLLLISGGSGITPMMSMLRTLRDEGYSGHVTFLHYTRAMRHIPHRDELERLADGAANVRLELVCTRQAGARDRHLSRARLKRLAPDYESAHTYVCGPPGLVTAMKALREKDSIEAPLHVESFQPALLRTGKENGERTVYFTRSGKLAVGDGRCLLELAEQAGLQPRFGCRMGICRMCTTRKTAGRVRNLRSGEISRAAEEDIQICVSAPAGDVELAL